MKPVYHCIGFSTPGTTDILWYYGVMHQRGKAIHMHVENGEWHLVYKHGRVHCKERNTDFEAVLAAIVTIPEEYWRTYNTAIDWAKAKYSEWIVCQRILDQTWSWPARLPEAETRANQPTENRLKAHTVHLTDRQWETLKLRGHAALRDWLDKQED